MASYFLLRSSFFRTISTVASSEAPDDYRPAPGLTDSIPGETSKTMDTNPSLQICGWNVDGTGRGYGIRQKSTKECISYILWGKQIHAFPSFPPKFNAFTDNDCHLK